MKKSLFIVKNTISSQIKGVGGGERVKHLCPQEIKSEMSRAVLITDRGGGWWVSGGGAAWRRRGSRERTEGGAKVERRRAE